MSPALLNMARKAKGVRPAEADPVLEEVQRLYRFMQEQGLECLEFARDQFKVRLVRQRPRALLSAAVGIPAASPPPTLAAPGPALPPGTAAIKSPLMGIFYRAPSPSSPPHVKEGDAVKSGQTLCVIEAMKVFNELKADFDCRIAKVLVENGKPVKVGQDLFAVTRGG